MRKKVVKKKSSPPSKNPLKKTKVVKRKKAIAKTRSAVKKVVKKKTATLKRRSAVKKVAKKKTATPKRRSAVKKVAKKKTATPKRRSAVKKVVKEKTATPKGRSAVKKVVKKKTAAGRLRKVSQRKKYMDTKQLKYFRRILTSRRNKLITEADRTVDYMQADSNTYADTIDQANQEEEFTLQLKERDRERKLLQKIDEALIKIDNREYGFCISCGAEIGVERLEARPTTDQCIDCKELDEIRERH